jgi:hypothetical protein
MFGFIDCDEGCEGFDTSARRDTAVFDASTTAVQSPLPQNPFALRYRRARTDRGTH